MTFSKTVGGLDPWTMPSDGCPQSIIHTDARTKKWERRQYHKARRRDARATIRKDIDEYKTLSTQED